MASDFDPTDFVDSDFQAHKAPATTTASSAAGSSLRAPSREEVDSKVLEAQQKLEETRRRRIEFQTGRQEMLQSLTRGVGLLEEAEFTARRDAEQMAKTLEDFRDALVKIQAVNEETWTKDNFGIELTRALTVVENARMEWNTARLKFPTLTGEVPGARETAPAAGAPAPSAFEQRSFAQLCKLGLALTWPLTVVALGTLATLIVILCLRR
jgi:hypothetical protein